MSLEVMLGAALVGAAAAVVVLLLGRGWRTGAASRRQQRQHDYQQLAVANGLTRAETKALSRIVRAAQLADPKLVFVRPSLLDSCAAPARVPAEAVRSLRAKLFGS